MSRADLAEKVSRDVLTVASWEQGYRRPKLQSILDIANIFGIPIQQLQTLAGYTPEFNWYLSFTAQDNNNEHDILLSARSEEKEELRNYLRYLRFKSQVTSAKSSALRESK